MEKDSHKAGFISIIGKPNVGKSTLMNSLVGERLSIVSPKAQTTRHRIMGIINEEHLQIVYSDTPGIIDPQYNLQETMMKMVRSSLSDADLILYVREIGEKEGAPELLSKLPELTTPIILVLNKMDKVTLEELTQEIDKWEKAGIYKKVIPVSALEKTNIGLLKALIVEQLPFHPPFFDKDQLTDRPERFFAAEIIREKIFLNYKQEIPYSCEVAITEFKESEDIIRMRAEIYVERDSQKGIIIGHKGESLKKVGIQARKDMEVFFNKQVHLETFVKVEPDWRRNTKALEKFGYIQKD